MKKLFILKGCPCSGKSFWAKEYKRDVDANVVIGNRDTIRYELGNGKYVQDQEDEVTRIETERVENGMKAGLTVILDDTNLNPKYIKPWYDMAEKYGYEVEEKEFYIPYQEAMKRSKARKAEGGLYIPKEVMQRFYKRYYKEEFEKELTDYRVFNTVEWDNDLPTCIICDLDGTLAMHTGRTPFEWDRLDEDKIDKRLALMLEIYVNNIDDCEVIFLTGRPDSAREATENWLKKYFNAPYTLLMRDSSDYSHGYDAKKKIYEDYIKGKYNVLCVFEDSNKCVDMWREQGLLTLQVQNGDY